MKKSALSLFIAGLCASSMLAAPASAAYGDAQYARSDFPHWYIGLQGSVTFLDEADVGITNAGSAELDFDSGYGIGGSLGYSPYGTNSFFDNTRFEVEYYYRNNDLDQYSSGGLTSQQSDEITSESFMFNGFYDFKNNSRVTPYLGAGAGVTKISLDLPALAVDDDDVVFAYQLMAGLGWQPENMLNTEFVLGYRYFDASDPEYSGIAGSRVDTEYQMHNIEAGARFKF